MATIHRRFLVLLGLPFLLLPLTEGCRPLTKPAPRDPAPQGRRPPPGRPTHHRLPGPESQIKNTESFRFLVFGDTRAAHTFCGRHGSKYKPCPVSQGRQPAVQKGCRPIDQIQALMLGRVSDLLADRKVLPPRPSGRDAFGLFTGDLVYRGSCAADWARARRLFLSRVPPERVFPVLGNHETWHGRNEPSPFPFFFKAYPHLRRRHGETTQQPHYYAFRVGRSLFLNLCTGGYPRFGKPEGFKRADRTWLCEQASFEHQMRWLDRQLAKAARHKIKHVFVQYHKPSYSCSNHPGLDDRHDPLFRLRPFKRIHPSINITVFNGHTHNTELYLTQGVVVLVAGGSGAPQHADWGPSSCHKNKKQPPERFWDGAKRPPRYNYFRVTVKGDRISIQERCLTRAQGRYSFENGVTISATGKLHRRPGACALK